MAITFFGVATTPADNSGSSPGPTVTLTPPASMVDGDLVIVSVRYRDSAATIATTPSNTGGQTWNAVTQYNATNIRARVFWCRYNGTWSANPAFTVTSGTNNIDAQMLVFRPTSAAYTWSLESGPNSATYTAPSTPFTVTITGRTTTAARTVSVAMWHSVDDNTWGTLSGTGWSKTSLGAQYRNNDTADNSSTFAYNIQASAGATNNVSQNQATLGGDAGSTSLFTFSETLITAAPTGNAGTAGAGSLAIGNPSVGIAGVVGTSAAGVATGPSSASNATGSPTGVTGSSFVGTATPNAATTRAPTGVAGTTAAGSPTVNGATKAAPSGNAGAASVGAITVIAAAAGVATVTGVSGAAAAGSLSTAQPIVGVAGAPATGGAGALVAQTAGATSASTQPPGESATAQAGALGGATSIVGLSGAQAAAGVGVVTVGISGLINATGQPPGRAITATAGDVNVSAGVLVPGVSGAAIAESLELSQSVMEVDGATGSAQLGATSEHSSTSIGGVAGTTAAGNLQTTNNIVVPINGVGAIATPGSAAASTGTQLSVVAEGVQAASAAGTIGADVTQKVDASGVEGTTAAGTVAVVGGDSSSTETYPAGGQAQAEAGTLVVAETRVSAAGVIGTAHAGDIRTNGRDPAKFPKGGGRLSHGHGPQRRAGGKAPRREA